MARPKREPGSPTERKATGSHFTPPGLARFVAGQVLSACPSLLEKGHLRVLDPACGDGELLLALADTLAEQHGYNLENVSFVGVETDPFAVMTSRTRLQSRNVRATIEHADFLAGTPVVQGQLTLDALTAPPSLQEPFDVVIANPPYVRTQVLGAAKAQDLAETFGLSGRVDLYQAFLIAMTQHLRSDGLLGVITSNRFLATKSGSDIRTFLAAEYDIIGIFDLGDTRLFEAAVLPAVFVGKRWAHPSGTQTSSARFVKIYEADSPLIAERQVSSVFEVLKVPTSGLYQVGDRKYEVTTGSLQLPDPVSDPWSMVTDEERDWVTRVERGMQCRLADLFKVRVGIKTTADDVFIRTDWSTLPEETRPENILLHRLISQEDAARWLPLDQSLSACKVILYTHEVRLGKRRAINLEDYPRAAAYLESHRPRLEGRKYVIQAKRNWFEIWVPQDPEAWAKPKLVFPDISPEPRFLFDSEGAMVDGNCYWIAAENESDLDSLFLVQGVANSKLMTRYHDLAFNNKLYAGRRRYLTQYVGKYPIPPLKHPSAQQVVHLVKQLVFGAPLPVDRKRLEAEIDLAVEEAFGLTV